MQMSEEQMREAEERIPELGRQAVAEAVMRAKSAGYSVVVSLGRQVVRIHPSGRQEVIKELPPKVSVELGKRRVID